LLNICNFKLFMPDIFILFIYLLLQSDCYNVNFIRYINNESFYFLKAMYPNRYYRLQAILTNLLKNPNLKIA
jgi:hypothetical protein